MITFDDVEICTGKPLHSRSSVSTTTTQTAFILLKEYPPNNPSPIVKAVKTPRSTAKG